MNANLKLELDKEILRELFVEVIDAKEQNKKNQDSFLQNKQNSSSQLPELLSINDLCKIFKVSRVTINTWMKDGRLPYSKMSRRVYFKYDDVMMSLKKFNTSTVQDFLKAKGV